MAKEMGVKHINVLMPLLDRLAGFFDLEASGVPGGEAQIQKTIVNTEYFLRIEAVQYAQQHLSGLNRSDWQEADIVLLGLSRTGKVSIAFFLAQYGVKAACVDCSPQQP